MRTVQNIHGYPVMISTDEYKLIRKIHALGTCPQSDLSGFFQELAESLYAKSVLECNRSGSEPVYSTVKPKE